MQVGRGLRLILRMVVLRKELPGSRRKAICRTTRQPKFVDVWSTGVVVSSPQNARRKSHPCKDFRQAQPKSARVKVRMGRNGLSGDRVRVFSGASSAKIYKPVVLWCGLRMRWDELRRECEYPCKLLEMRAKEFPDL